MNDRQILEDAVRREPEDFYSGQRLHLWNAVLVKWVSAQGRHETRVMLAEIWDDAKLPLFAGYGAENFTVYDGRELFSSP